MKLYESPIIKYTEDIILNNLVEKEESFLVESVHKVGFDIDKEELAKALQYDRNQYEKGFNDGRASAINEMPTIEPEITEDGTLFVNVQDASMVGRVLVADNKNVGGLYYLSDEGSNIIHCKDCQYWKRLITDAHKCSILRWLTKPEDFCSFCAKERRQ